MSSITQYVTAVSFLYMKCERGSALCTPPLGQPESRRTWQPSSTEAEDPRTDGPKTEKYWFTSEDSNTESDPPT